MKTGHILRRAAAAVAVAGSCLLAPGCIKVEQNLTLNGSGGGTLQLVYAMQERHIAQIDAARRLAMELDAAAGVTNAAPDPSLSMPLVFDEGAIRTMFEPLASGVTLDRLRVDVRSGWKTANLSIVFSSLETLAKAPIFAAVPFSISRTREGSYRLFEQVLTTPTPPNLSDPTVERSLFPELAGLKLQIRVNVPGTILSSNATRTYGRTVVWEVDFDKNPRSVTLLQQDGMQVVFSSDEARLPEVTTPAYRDTGRGGASPSAAPRRR